MTTKTAAPITVTIEITDADIRTLARHLFSVEVQGSRLDLRAYDTDTDRQAYWAQQAEETVERSAAQLAQQQGPTVTRYLRVRG